MRWPNVPGKLDISDLHLLWCKYCYMNKVVKTDCALGKLLSYNCRYLGDICTVKSKYFGDMVNDIYDNTMLLEDSAFNYKHDTFLNLDIRLVDETFVTSVYHKDYGFHFDAFISQGNIHSVSVYTAFYSQLIRLYRRCNDINDFLFQSAISRWSNMVTCTASSCFKTYNIDGNYGDKNCDLIAYD